MEDRKERLSVRVSVRERERRHESHRAQECSACMHVSLTLNKKILSWQVPLEPGFFVCFDHLVTPAIHSIRMSMLLVVHSPMRESVCKKKKIDFSCKHRAAAIATHTASRIGTVMCMDPVQTSRYIISWSAHQSGFRFLYSFMSSSSGKTMLAILFVPASGLCAGGTWNTRTSPSLRFRGDVKQNTVHFQQKKWMLISWTCLLTACMACQNCGAGKTPPLINLSHFS